MAQEDRRASVGKLGRLDVDLEVVEVSAREPRGDALVERPRLDRRGALPTGIASTFSDWAKRGVDEEPGRVLAHPRLAAGARHVDHVAAHAHGDLHRRGKAPTARIDDARDEAPAFERRRLRVHPRSRQHGSHRGLAKPRVHEVGIDRREPAHGILRSGGTQTSLLGIPPRGSANAICLLAAR